MNGAKAKRKIQKRLGQIGFGKGDVCWVCGRRSGLKTCREASGTRCKKCMDAGKMTPEVLEYIQLKDKLEKLNNSNS
jgi:hypothetical protein